MIILLVTERSRSCLFVQLNQFLQVLELGFRGLLVPVEENLRPFRELAGEPYPEKIDWFAWEWAWVRDGKVYPNTPQETDLSSLAKEILTV